MTSNVPAEWPDPLHLPGCWTSCQRTTASKSTSGTTRSSWPQWRARARLGAVTDWIAARDGSLPPDPATVDAAVAILATPPARRDVSVSVHPATVWRVHGHLVAVYHFGSRVGALATAECSCVSEGLCEHLLVVLPGTEACR